MLRIESSPVATASQPRTPLYVPHREYPRPAAKAWLQRLSSLYGVEYLPTKESSPWLPLTVIEGFLVVGHKNTETEMTEFPRDICIPVQLRPRDYDRLVGRCIDSMSLFVASSGKQLLASAWSDHISQCEARYPRAVIEDANDEEALHRYRRTVVGLGFVIAAGLTSRQSTSLNPETFLRENPDIEWLMDALSVGDPVYPLDDLQTSGLHTSFLPEQVVAKFKAICYEKDEAGVHVLLPAGTSVGAFTTALFARMDTEVEVRVAFAERGAITQLVENASVMVTASSDAVIADDTTDTGELDCDADPELFKLRMDAITTANDVLRRAIGEALTTNATDIHFDAMDANHAVVRFRINGYLRARGTISFGMLARVLTVIKVRSRMDLTQTRLPQDGKFRVRSGSREAEVRVSTVPVEKGFQTESCALRILGRVVIPSIELVGMNPHQVQQARWVMGGEDGIFLVTGPTGSGKTTTLNCMLKEVAGEELNVMSVEDPVELPMQWVKQMQVHEGINFTFASSLKHILRHDPDVVMVGEIRDRETADTAMQAALTGHLVFSTLHTNSALISIDRLSELGIERSRIAGSVRGVAAQRLVRCLCPHCREVVPIEQEHRAYVSRYLCRLQRTLDEGDKSTAEIRKPSPDGRELEKAIVGWLEKGETYRRHECSACNNTGFHKQKAIVELYLIANEPTAVQLILTGRPTADLQKFFDSTGHLDLAGQSLRAVVTHETSFDEIKQRLPLL